VKFCPIDWIFWAQYEGEAGGEYKGGRRGGKPRVKAPALDQESDTGSGDCPRQD